MFASDLKAIQESYQGIYEEGDGISCEMIEEVVEELIQECVEFGYTLDEASTAVENAAILYLDEAKVTYGSDTESPEQRKARAKERLGGMKSSARKAAVKDAVKRVQAKAKGAKAAAGIAASIAKDEARRAGRAATHAVSSTVQKKKAEVKGGIKRMIGGGLRAAATGIGKVAQKAAGAASRLGEEYIDEASKTDDNTRRLIKQYAGKKGITFEPGPRWDSSANRGKGANLSHKQVEKQRRKSLAKSAMGEEVQIYDIVLEYLLETGHAETVSEAQYIMTQMNSESIEAIVETRMDPRGRPASGPMSVYAKSKPNNDPAFQAALKSYAEKQKAKSPEQKKAELDAYIARQRNK
jgi:hypothetical protein